MNNKLPPILDVKTALNLNRTLRLSGMDQRLLMSLMMARK